MDRYSGRNPRGVTCKSKALREITASFGGLLLRIRGPVTELGELKMDEKI